MAPIVTFIGGHADEKAVLINQVVSHLRALGYKVAVINSSDTLEEQEPQQLDSGDMLDITSGRMVLRAHNIKLPLSTLAHRYFPDADIVIGNGFNAARRVAKIEVIHDEAQALRDEIPGVIALVTNFKIQGESVFQLQQTAELAEFLQKKFLADKEDSTVLVSLLLNGKKIPLKKFVQEALAGTVLGFISTLKFTDTTSEIDLRIQFNPTDNRTRSL